MNQKRTPILDAYIRVSRVAGRTGDSYISPKVQQDDIERWASVNRVRIGEIVIEEDVSGNTPLEERALGQLVERCERGESDGVIVYRIDRFSRSLRDTFDAIERFERAGARLVGSNDGLDSSSKSGEIVISMMAALARQEWVKRRDNWAEATRRAVQDGVHISSKPPTGYVRDGKRSRLRTDEAVAPLVRDCFIRRANGESWLQLAEYMSAHGVPMSKSGVAGMVKNRAYLGEARGPNKLVLAGAHEPLVTVEVWEAAQLPGRTHAKTGTIAAQGMLSGLIRCAACGNKLSVTGSTNKSTGEREASYFCKGHSAKGRCPAPSASRVKIVDNYVASAISQALVEGTLQGTVDSVADYRRAIERVRGEERSLRELANLNAFKSVGVEEFGAMVASQEEILVEAREALRNTPKPEDAVEPTADLWEAEAWPIERQRMLARQFISSVSLSRGGKRRWSRPIEERVEIQWAGHDQPDSGIAERISKSESRVLDPLVVGN